MSIAYLKVFTGTHKDAIVPLENNRVLIGGIDSADIVLIDDFIKDKSFVVDIKSSVFILHSSSDQLIWSSSIINKLGYEVVFFSCEDLIIGFSEDMNVLSSVDANEIEFQPYAFNNDNSSQFDVNFNHDRIDAADTLKTDNFNLDNDNYKDSYDQEDETDEEYTHQIDSEISSKKPIVIIVSLAFITFLGCVYFGFYSVKNEKTDSTSISCDKQFNKVFHDPIYKNVELIKNADKLLISGYVETYNELIEVKNKSSQLQCATLDNVYSQQQIISNVRNMLPQNLISSLYVDSNNVFGHVKVKGYAKQNSDWPSVKKRILQDVKGLKTIDDNVLTVESHLTILQQMLIKYELAGYVHFKMVDGKIRADMVFNPSMNDKWKIMLANYKDDYPVGPEIVMDNVNISQLGIAGISQGRISHIILSSGEKFVVGSILPNGSVLTRVDDDGLVLSTVNGEIKYPISTLF